MSRAVEGAAVLQICLGNRHVMNCHHTSLRTRVRALYDEERAFRDDDRDYWRGWNAAIEAVVVVLNQSLGTDWEPPK